MQDEMVIRAMARDEIGMALEWAAAEGWNPGLGDVAAFSAVDSGGFLVGEIDGRPAAIVSCNNYDDTFAFLGFYIVRPELRGRGYGLKMWRAAMAHAGERVVGLDGVVAQQENYRRSGFAPAHANFRHGGVPVLPPGGTEDGTVPLAEVPFALLEASDAEIFPAPRPAFLRAWMSTPGHRARALMRDGVLAAWGVIRPSRDGRRIGPLVAHDTPAARTLLRDLIGTEDAGPVFLDVPATNAEALALATSFGLSPAFETARMYTGPIRPLRLDRLYGISTLELG